MKIAGLCLPLKPQKERRYRNAVMQISLLTKSMLNKVKIT
jgi:hypothetical protein